MTPQIIEPFKTTENFTEIPQEIWVVSYRNLKNERVVYTTFFEINAKKQAAQLDGPSTIIKYKFDGIRSLTKKTKEKIREEIQTQVGESRKVRRVRKAKASSSE